VRIESVPFSSSLVSSIMSLSLGLITTDSSVKLELWTIVGRLPGFKNITSGSESTDVLWEKEFNLVCLTASSGRAGKGTVGGGEALGTERSLRGVRRGLEHDINQKSNQQKQLKREVYTKTCWKIRHLHFAFCPGDSEKQCWYCHSCLQRSRARLG